MSNVYLDAADLIEKADWLAKGDMKEKQKYRGGTELYEAKEWCYCTMGAVLEASGQLAKFEDSGPSGEDEPPTHAQWFLDLMGPVSREINPTTKNNPFHVIYIWNDAAVRTKEEAIELLRRVGEEYDA